MCGYQLPAHLCAPRPYYPCWLGHTIVFQRYVALAYSPAQAPARYHNITAPPHAARKIGPAQIAQTLRGSAFVARNPRDRRWRKLLIGSQR